MSTFLLRVNWAIDWLSAEYRPAPRAMAALRIILCAYLLARPRDVRWIGETSEVVFYPPPGPFTLLTAPPGPSFFSALFVLQIAAVIWVMFGWNTRIASGALSAVLIVGSGLSYSYSKVDHTILFDIAPLMLGLAGWGSAWSVDAWRRKSAPTNGLAMFAYASIVAFGLFTAALIKAVSGWLNPAVEATHFYIAAQVGNARTGSLTSWILGFDNPIFWKSLDYMTVAAEGWLILAVFFPGIFRIGLLVMGLFHVGVWLTLGIDFQSMAFVYMGFFMKPISRWLPEIPLINCQVKKARKIGTR